MATLFRFSLFVLLASNTASAAHVRAHKTPLHRRTAPPRVISARQVIGVLPPASNALSMGPGPEVVPASGSLTAITSSPHASPVPIIQQSQVVTTYVPQYTLCELSLFAHWRVSTSNTGFVGPQPLNLSTAYPIPSPLGNRTCSTFMSPTQTTVCSTTLTGLVTTYPVTDCTQQITFSSQLGYSLVTPTATPAISSNDTTVIYSNSSLITPALSIQTLTTYYFAPWQELTRAGTPPAYVNLKICSAATDDTDVCLSEQEGWATQLATISTTTTSSFNFTATILGPAQLVVETFVANITETLTTFTMETELVLSTTVITETLSTSKVSTPAQSTDTSTVTVLQASYAQPRYVRDRVVSRTSPY